MGLSSEMGAADLAAITGNNGGRDYGNYSGYRDSRGRYSRDDMMERTKSQIERLMNESQNEEVREALQGALQRLH